MDGKFFEQIFWGNTIQAYCWFVGIILIGLLLKRFVSRVISQFLFKLFKKFADEVQMETS
jgi:MscS family membrane protein